MGRRCLRPPAAILAALLTAVSPFYVYYAQETRGYALLLLTTLLSAYAALRLLRQPTRRWLCGYVGASAAVLFTHYYGLLVVLFENVFFLTLLVGRGRPAGPPRVWLQAARPWLVGQVALALLYLPWAWGNASRFGGYASATRDALNFPSFFWQTVIGFGLGHSVERYNAAAGDPGYLADHQMAMALSLALLAFAAVGAAAAWRRRALNTDVESAETGEEELRRGYRYAILWLLIPAIALYLLSAGKRDFTARYLIVSTPAYFLLIAAGLVALRRLSVILFVSGTVTAVAIGGYALWNYYADAKYWRDDHRAAAAYVQRHTMDNEGAILNASLFHPAFTYYYKGKAPWYGLPEEHPPDEAHVNARLRELGQRHDFIWLVLWQDYYSDPAQLVESYLDRHYIRTREATFRGNIKVRGYRTRSAIVEAELPAKLVVGEELGGQVELRGYALDGGSASAGEELALTLYWRALEHLSNDYTVFVHLINSADQVIAQVDGPPVHGRLPTSAWPPGATIEDERRLLVPAHTPPGEYSLLVGLYDRQTLRRLGAGGVDRMRLGPLTVARGKTQAAVPNRVAINLGSTIHLVGYTIEGEARPGGSLRVELFWQARAKTAGDLTVFVHLEDERGERRAQDDAKPAGGSYPTTVWQPEEIVRDRHALALPADLPRGSYRIVVGLYDAVSGDRLSYRKWPWLREETGVFLDKVAVSP